MAGNVLHGISRANRALWMMNPLAVSGILFALTLFVLLWGSSLNLRDAKFLKHVPAQMECTQDGGQFQILGGGKDGNQYLLVCEKSAAKSSHTFLVKRVGFLWALNWSLGVCLVFPLIIGLALWSVQNFFHAIETTHRRKMLVKRNELQPIVLSPYANRFWGRALFWCLIGFLIGFCLIVKDYKAVVLNPLECARNGSVEGPCAVELFDPASTEFEREYDWSISAAFPMVYKEYYKDKKGSPLFESDAGRAALKKLGAYYDGVSSNLMFSTVVYLLNALMSGIVTAYYALLGLAAAQVYKFSVRKKVRKSKERLDVVSVMPDLSSNSICKGFELFAPAVHGVLLTCFFGVVAMYLMRVQNLFLRADYSYIGDFFLNNPGQHLKKAYDAASQIPEGKLDMPSAFDNLTEIIVMALNDTQAWYALVASVIVIYVSSVFFIVVLRSAANNSRARVKFMLESRPDDVAAYYKRAFNLDTLDDVKNSLKNMKIWPVAWPNEKKTALFMLMGIIFLTFYKLFPWFLIACCAMIVTWAWRSTSRALE